VALAAGTQIGPCTALLKLPLLWLAHRLVQAVLLSCLALFWLVNVVTAIVEYLARLIAWPMTTIIRLARSRRDTHSHATIA
jgi:hypothetical protein